MKMSKKLPVPINPLIFETAAKFAAEFYEVGRMQGMTSKYKNHREYTRAYVEKFIPLAIKTLIEMLKPGNSRVSEHMKEAIHAALTDPLNDKNLMEAKVDPEFRMDVLQEQLAKSRFDKNKITLNTSQSNLLNSTGFTSPKVN